MAHLPKAILAVAMLKGSPAGNFAGEDLGKIDDLVVDFATGQVRYLILSLHDKLCAVPWELCSLRAVDHQFLIDTEKQILLAAPAFEPTHWPDMSSDSWATAIRSYFATKPYCSSDITCAGDYAGNDRLDKSDRDRV